MAGLELEAGHGGGEAHQVAAGATGRIPGPPWAARTVRPTADSPQATGMSTRCAHGGTVMDALGAAPGSASTPTISRERVGTCGQGV